MKIFRMRAVVLPTRGVLEEADAYEARLNLKLQEMEVEMQKFYNDGFRSIDVQFLERDRTYVIRAAQPEKKVPSETPTKVISNVSGAQAVQDLMNMLTGKVSKGPEVGQEVDTLYGLWQESLGNDPFLAAGDRAKKIIAKYSRTRDLETLRKCRSELSTLINSHRSEGCSDPDCAVGTVLPLLSRELEEIEKEKIQ